MGGARPLPHPPQPEATFGSVGCTSGALRALSDSLAGSDGHVPGASFAQRARAVAPDALNGAFDWWGVGLLFRYGDCSLGRPANDGIGDKCARSAVSGFKVR